MCDHCGCRTFGPIAELTEEHEEILRLAWEAAESGHIGAPVDRRVLDELVARLDVHVTKEETGLYPGLLESGDCSAQQIGGLEAEHRALRAAVVSGVFRRREFYALAAHIEEEETELFPAAMFGFDEDDWDAMDAAHRAAAVAARS